MTAIELFYKSVIRPPIFWLTRNDPERAHEFGLRALERLQESSRLSSLARRFLLYDHGMLSTTAFSLHFSHPFGLAAGYDKYGRVYHPGVPLCGWGFCEVGGITALEQDGNPREKGSPRIRRSLEYEAMWNWLGLNNPGAIKAAAAMHAHPFPNPPIRVGVNISKSHNTAPDDAPKDYAFTASKLWAYADFIVIQWTCPNDPGMKVLKRHDHQLAIAQKAQEMNVLCARSVKSNPKPMGIKISADDTDEEIADTIDVCRKTGMRFIVAVNSTRKRGQCQGWGIPHHGGVTGKPLEQDANRIVRMLYGALRNSGIHIIGVGGIRNGATLYDRILNGANVCEGFTAWPFEGPDFVKRCLEDLVERLQSDNFTTVDQAVGKAL